MAGEDRVIRHRRKVDEFLAQKLEESDAKRMKANAEEPQGGASAAQGVGSSGSGSSSSSSSSASQQASGGSAPQGIGQRIGDAGDGAPSASQKRPRQDDENDVAMDAGAVPPGKEDCQGGGGGKRKVEGEEDVSEQRENKRVMVGGMEVNQEDDEPEAWYPEDGDPWDAMDKQELVKDMETCDSAALESVRDVKSGEVLDGGLMSDARSEELTFMESLGAFEESSWEECVEKTGRPPVSTKWVDTDKGGEREAGDQEPAGGPGFQA